MSYILDALKRAEAERERGSVPTLRSQPAVLASSGAAAGSPTGASARRVLPLRWLPALAGLAALGWLLWPQGAVPPAAPPAPQPTTTATAAAAPAVPPVGPELKRLQTLPPPELAPVPAAAPVQPATTASAPQPPVALKSLPEAQRRGLPPLLVGGAMYSENPAARMLILDGQLRREGDSLAPGLRLEQIGHRGALLVLQRPHQHQVQHIRIEY